MGAVEPDEDLEAISELSRFVCPFIYEKLDYHAYILTSTQIGQFQKEDEAFVQVMWEFFHWRGVDNGGEVIFYGWDNADLLELQHSLHFFHIRNPFSYSLSYYDIQKPYRRCFLDAEKKATVLTTAMEVLGPGGEGTFHRAIEDVCYTTKVLQQPPFGVSKIYRSLDYYHSPADEDEKFHIDFPDYAEYMSRTFPGRDNAIHDKAVTDMFCYHRHRMLRKKLYWLSANQRSYHCIAVYPEHGLLRGELKIRRAEGMQVYYIKTTKFVNQGTAERIA